MEEEDSGLEDGTGKGGGGGGGGGREEGYVSWKASVERRFVSGEDEEFDYGPVDQGEEFDDLVVEEREAQERWFEEEDVRFMGPEGESGRNRSPGEGGRRELQGETGVQDF